MAVKSFIVQAPGQTGQAQWNSAYFKKTLDQAEKGLPETNTLAYYENP